ncbi:MAG: IreB family regulatory phosphoprotein [Eubacteriales bacterium]|nr:IreB family regulatory phosphoprotein [Eubacteriales bacterium]
MRDTTTQFFDVSNLPAPGAAEIIAEVYDALTKKGYNPNSQLIGYIISGDPTYITSYNNARTLIMKIDRDELLEELLNNYIETKLR